MADIYRKVQEHALVRPESVAFWQVGGAGKPVATTYRQLATGARQFAAAFYDRAADSTLLPIYSGKTRDTVAAMLGARGAGKGFAYLNFKLRAPQVNAILDACSAKLALLDGVGAMNLRGTYEGGPDITRTRWWYLRSDPELKVHATAVREMRQFCDVEDMVPADKEPAGVDDITLDGIGCCLFTSGSTGDPKGVLVSSEDMGARAEAEIEWFHLSQEDILLSILPFSFDVGLNQLLSALTVGCSLVFLDSWLPIDILHTVAMFQVTGISAVPTIWLDMMNSGLRFDTAGGHKSLRYITVSGGDLPQPYLERLPSHAPKVNVFKTYGQTETFRSTCLRPEEFAKRRESVGRAFEGVNLYVVRENGSECDANEVGEIVHSGLGVMSGYIGGIDSENKRRPNPFYGERDRCPIAVFTGDYGYLDKEGYLFLKGRADLMLKISGNRVYPKEIINQLLTLDGILEAEVVGIKKDDGSSYLVAFVVQAGGAAMDQGEMRRALGKLLPSFMVPERILKMKNIPRTTSGKPDLKELARLGGRI